MFLCKLIIISILLENNSASSRYTNTGWFINLIGVILCEMLISPLAITSMRMNEYLGHYIELNDKAYKL